MSGMANPDQSESGVASSMAGERGFQYSLAHMFMLISLAAFYFAISRWCGPFFATLGMGTLIISAIVVLARLGSFFSAGVLGALLASVILVAAGQASVSVAPATLAVACLIYPALGYAIGVFCAGCLQMRSG